MGGKPSSHCLLGHAPRGAAVPLTACEAAGPAVAALADRKPRWAPVGALHFERPWVRGFAHAHGAQTVAGGAAGIAVASDGSSPCASSLRLLLLLLLSLVSSAAVVVEPLTSSVAMLLVLALALALVLVLALALLLSLSLAAVVVGHRRRRPLSLKLALLLWLSMAAGPRLREAVESGYRVLGPSARRTKKHRR